ncbi:hypothetical protein EVAR_29056_1 [Eumeta japonica]|uniref:Uncharacterized protein n=1 Tax=Eumeta variegata TaxID=151549 RepID=A0A4C1W1W4_EUMVA|nr:hypothetical protein EVAR_29056_1 [Eumeta japonica]
MFPRIGSCTLSYAEETSRKAAVIDCPWKKDTRISEIVDHSWSHHGGGPRAMPTTEYFFSGNVLSATDIMVWDRASAQEAESEAEFRQFSKSMVEKIPTIPFSIL